VRILKFKYHARSLGRKTRACQRASEPNEPSARKVSLREESLTAENAAQQSRNQTARSPALRESAWSLLPLSKAMGHRKREQAPRTPNASRPSAHQKSSQSATNLAYCCAGKAKSWERNRLLRLDRKSCSKCANLRDSTVKGEGGRLVMLILPSPISVMSVHRVRGYTHFCI